MPLIHLKHPHWIFWGLFLFFVFHEPLNYSFTKQIFTIPFFLSEHSAVCCCFLVLGALWERCCIVTLLPHLPKPDKPGVGITLLLPLQVFPLTGFKSLFATSRADDVFIFGTQFLYEAI